MPPAVPRAEGGRPPGDGSDNRMGKEVAPASLGGGHRAADVGAFPEIVEGMSIDENTGLLPMVVPVYSAQLPSNPLAGLPPHAASLVEVQPLQENLEKLTELLTNLMGKVERMSAVWAKKSARCRGHCPRPGGTETRSKLSAQE